MFPTDLTAVLTGASVAQLRNWNKTGLLHPEVATTPQLLYSFRDIVALRSVVHLRREHSLQRIRRALANANELDFSEHPSRYRFSTDGDTITLTDDEGATVDLVKNPGQQHIPTLADVFAEFTNKRGQVVADFRHPRRRLEVRAARMGGWPTIKGTRIPYDTIAQLVEGGDVSVNDVQHYYPDVTPAAARDALDFEHAVREAAA